MDHSGAVIGPLIGYVLLLLFADGSKRADGRRLPEHFSPGFDSRAGGRNGGCILCPRIEKPETSRLNAPGADAVPPLRLSLRGFNSNFKRFLPIIALFTLSNSSDFFLLLRARDAGVSVASIPLLWAGLHVTKVLSSIFGGDLSDRLGRRRLIVSGWILYAAVYAGFAFVSNPVSVWILFLIYGIYFGLAEGAEKALVADLVRPEQRGTATACIILLSASLCFPRRC